MSSLFHHHKHNPPLDKINDCNYFMKTILLLRISQLLYFYYKKLGHFSLTYPAYFCIMIPSFHCFGPESGRERRRRGRSNLLRFILSLSTHSEASLCSLNAVLVLLLCHPLNPIFLPRALVLVHYFRSSDCACDSQFSQLYRSCAQQYHQPASKK